MNVMRSSCPPSRKKGTEPVLSLRNRLSLAVVCLLSALFLQVPAAATLQGLYVGAEAPDFSLKDLAGQSHAFKDIKGAKLTMVIFWSTWSRNSEKMLTCAQKLYASYKDKGLAVVAINANGLQITPDETNEMQAIVAKLGLKYPVLLDEGLKVFHDYGVIALPSTVIMDPVRTIRYELSGFPLVGSDEMIDFTKAQIEGRKTETVAQRKGYQPDKKALRLFNMGENAQRSRRMAATAEGWYKKAIEADPRFVQPHLSLGKFYEARNHPDLAKEQYNMALEKEPENAVALCELGMLLIGEDKPEEGKALMQKAMKAEEFYTPCYYYLGYAYGKEGNMDEASSMFARALEINRLDTNIFLYKGRMLEETGKKAEAAEAYRQTLALVLDHEKR